MASRGPRPLLLLLLAACLVLASGHSWDPLHKIFKLKHVDHPRTPADNDNAYCNKLMWGRGLFLKPSHTFIADSPAKINCVCKKGGVKMGPMKFKSIVTFDLTTCTKNHWTFSFDGIRHRHHIVVLCLHGRPIKLLKYV
ncbi:ribonuclease pancreatic-like [Pelodiscus sinensis]|uniref:ribonuclease pancreatic-like n=1 Tax=Pelodiscus sinensis TaxID=13735 RepID=UPI003F6BB76E